MFSKKKKKPEISTPSNFQHRVHTGYDNTSNKFVGLPKQWASLVQDVAGNSSPQRPTPMVDPSTITPTDIIDLKVKITIKRQISRASWYAFMHKENKTKLADGNGWSFSSSTLVQLPATYTPFIPFDIAQRSKFSCTSNLGEGNCTCKSREEIKQTSLAWNHNFCTTYQHIKK